MQRSKFLGAALGVILGGMAQSAFAQSEIKIGEINSYSLLPAFTEPYRKGWQLAVEEINAAGGINGKKLVVVSKDDGGKPADAQTAAGQVGGGASGAGRRRRQSGSDPQRHLRRRPGKTGSRRQHPRPVQGSRGGQLPHRRAGISRSAEGRDPRGLDRHRLSLVLDQ